MNNIINQSYESLPIYEELDSLPTYNESQNNANVILIEIITLNNKKAELYCDKYALVHDIYTKIEKALLIPVDFIERLICNGFILCPKQPIISLTINNSKIKIYVIYCLSIGIKPPSTLVNYIDFITTTKSIQSYIIYSD